MDAALAIVQPIMLPMVAKADILTSFLNGRKQTTKDAYEADLLDFAKFLGVQDPAVAAEALTSLSHGDANRVALAYRARMTERGLSAATIARRLATLRSMAKVARQIGQISWCLDVESPKSKAYRDTRGPSLNDRRQLLSEAKKLATTAQGKRDLALVRLAHDLGLRRGECVSLDLADVDLTRESPAVYVTGKGKEEPEWMTLSRPAIEALREWLTARGDRPGPLFIRLDRAAGGNLGRLTGDSACVLIRGLSKKAGLAKEVRPHGLRHAAITRLLDLTNGDVRKVQRFSRHAKIETVMIYDDARKDEAGSLARLLGEDE